MKLRNTLLYVVVMSMTLTFLSGCSALCEEEEPEPEEEVVLDRVKFIGTYSTIEDCRIGPDDNYEVKIVAGEKNDEITMLNLYNQNEELRGVVVGNAISIPEQQVSDISYFATGTLDSNKLFLNFSVANVRTGATDRCTASCTKK